MLDRRHAKYLLAAGGVMLALCWTSSIANGATASLTGFFTDVMTFEDGGLCRRGPPARPYTRQCIAAISWSNPPPGVKSYALPLSMRRRPIGQIDIIYGPVWYSRQSDILRGGGDQQASPAGKFVVGKGNRANRPRGEEGTYSGPARRSVLRRTITYSSSSQPISTRRHCRRSELGGAVNTRSKATSWTRSLFIGQSFGRP